MSLTQHLLADTAAGSTTASPPLMVSFLLAGLWAWRGYKRAERIERETGYRAWGWSPTAWSVMCFCTTLLGRLLLESAASRAAKRRAKPAAPWSSAPLPAPAFGYGPVPVMTAESGTAPLPYFTASAARDILPGR